VRIIINFCCKLPDSLELTPSAPLKQRSLSSRFCFSPDKLLPGGEHGLRWEIPRGRCRCTKARASLDEIRCPENVLRGDNSGTMRARLSHYILAPINLLSSSIIHSMCAFNTFLRAQANIACTHPAGRTYGRLPKMLTLLKRSYVRGRPAVVVVSIAALKTGIMPRHGIFVCKRWEKRS
jgi:hypothetical protein